MRKDYHMHPTVLKKPERFPLFVQKALEMGVGEICVTDHMPLSISHAKDRLERGTVREYCARVRELAEEYRDKIKIKCGIEIDYHPSVIGEIEQVLGEGDFDVILGSSHIHIFEKENCARYTYNDFAKMALENSVCVVVVEIEIAFDVLSAEILGIILFNIAKYCARRFVHRARLAVIRRVLRFVGDVLKLHKQSRAYG